MTVRGSALLSWPLVFPPLRDAVIEDSLDRAELACSGAVAVPAWWSPYLRMLRRLAPVRTTGRLTAGGGVRAPTGKARPGCYPGRRATLNSSWRARRRALLALSASGAKPAESAAKAASR
jgi:hypothetical protein